MFGFFKKGMKSNKAVNPVSHAQSNMDEIARLNQERMNQVNNAGRGLDDRTKQMMERMNKLNGR